MRKPMSGEKDYTERAVDKMNRAMGVLDEYESGIGLPKHQPPGTEDELQEFLTWDRKIVEGMSPDQCAGVAYRLAQYSFYLQRELNREEARMKWAKSQLEDTIATELGQYNQYMKHETKVSMICRENSYAKVIRQIQNKAESRVTRLTYLSAGIRNLSDTMIAVQRTKARKHE
jgi:hypothetical protein